MNMRKSIRTALIPAAVATLGLLSAAHASSEPASITVKYSVLDLSSAAGANALYQRIGSAARQVCGNRGRTLLEQTQWSRCYRGAVGDAVLKVNSPALTAVHTGHAVTAQTAMLRR